MRALARLRQPREACGLLFGTMAATTAAVVRMVPAANVSGEPLSRFEIDPTVLLAAQRRSRTGPHRWIGHWHSHPRGAAVPSAADIAAIGEPDHLWLIVAGSELRAWHPRGGGFAELALAEVDGRVCGRGPGDGGWHRAP